MPAVSTEDTFYIEHILQRTRVIPERVAKISLVSNVEEQ